MATTIQSRVEEVSDLRAADRVLRLEAEGLRALAASLDGSFTDAIDLLAGLSGRVVVTGMGKSGLVGRKVAATLASVGTPALFVHPAEASHGDLGMIAKNDAVIAISNSGGTAELTDVIHYARRFSIPMVAITAGSDSVLAEAADIALVLPRSAEACPMGLAPTTSTTMAMALGDALAVALLERRGFSTDDFHSLHPGGKLGRQLLRVVDVMHTGDEVPLVDSNVTMQEALLQMTGKRFGCIGIVGDAGDLLGIITDGDLRRHMGETILQQRVTDIMTADPLTIRPQALAAEAISFMDTRRINILFVVEHRQPVGIVHVHDLVRSGII